MIHKFALPNTNTATIPDIANTLARRAMARGATIRLRTSTAMVPARENASGAVRNQPAPVAITVPQAVTRNRLLREVPSGAREQERDSGSSRLWWWGRNGARRSQGDRPTERLRGTRDRCAQWFQSMMAEHHGNGICHFRDAIHIA